MKVKELLKELEGLPDDMEVVMSRDGEGNSYSPLAQVDSENVAYMADCTYSGEVGLLELTDEAREMGYAEDDVIAGEPAVVLWPTN